MFTERNLLRSQTMLLYLFRNQMLLGNMEFFIFRVTADFDQLDRIKQRTRNRLQRICRRNKKHFRQIKRNFQIMISELMILFVVQHFQKSRKRISFIVCTHFVDFIQKHDGIFYSRSPKSVSDPPRHCSDICSSVSSYFRFISDSA